MVTFFAYGHPNILGLHRNTIEFTKESHLSKKGDCILGVRANFSLAELKKIPAGPVKVTMTAGQHTEAFMGLVNPAFESDSELVFRKSEFASERTFLCRIDRACSSISRDFVDSLKNADTKIKVTIEKPA